MNANSFADSSKTISERDASDGRIPLVILSGFLGAGKTTVLSHLLRQAKSRRIATLINDVGEVNIDAALTRDVAQLDSRPAEEIMELSNGCICCSSQDSFGEAVIELAKRKPDCIVVEASGVAEPRGIIASLMAQNEDGTSPLDYVRILNLVTIVDAEWWVKKIQEAYTPIRRSLMFFSDPRRPLSELLTLQVECANVIVLNKADLADEKSLERSRAALEAICPAAEIFTSREGQVETEQLLDQERFDISTAFKHSRCDIELAADSGTAEKNEPQHYQTRNYGEFGLKAFVFRARYPIRHDSLLKYLRSKIPGLLRAKGFVWTDREPDRAGYLSLAGDTLRFDHLGKWMHVLVKSGEMDRSRIPAEVWRKWEPETGDRRQEIVFIGIDLDREAIEHSLKSIRVDPSLKA